MSEKKSLNDELIVNVSRARPKFKAGSELAKSVNLMDVDSSKNVTEDAEIIKVSMRMSTRTCFEGSKELDD
ncbi:hypothetical protein CW751_08140 [Brumimicrobium salinarum]|uniref:Uncharacterized protein n=1 Tax=Brumimicrobium salinarum TaxID=2058658 RepID=A0A2I0R2C3_9FLAO|nr:hypothetical protein [Brumimicrobium salinarum]PKR80731.1 hypothetical protein CW751_08140 [Brumimicrobium salinarum]